MVENATFASITKKIKYWGINIPEMYKTYMRKTLKHSKGTIFCFLKCKDVPCSWIEWFSLINKSVLSKLIYKFKSISINLPISFLKKGVRLTDTKVLMVKQTYKNSQENTEKGNPQRSVRPPDIKISLKPL